MHLVGDHGVHDFFPDASSVDESLGGATFTGFLLAGAVAVDAGGGELDRTDHDHSRQLSEVRALVGSGQVVEDVRVCVERFLTSESPHQPGKLSQYHSNCVPVADDVWEGFLRETGGYVEDYYSCFFLVLLCIISALS